MREAIGVCGLITPWNWPLYQITAKVGPALAAGCTVVLKPSELSPLSALLFAEVMHDAGIPAGCVQPGERQGPEVGAALAAHPDVDMISITGSTRAGVLVAQAAAPTVKRVAQELGGKSPNVILPDADLARAVPAGGGGRLPQRRPILQRSDAHDRAPRAPRRRSSGSRCEAASSFVVGDPRSPQTTHGPVANRAQFNRVQEMIGIGIAEGARLVCGGPGRPRGLEPRLLLPPDHLLRGASANADRAGGDLRAGARASFPTTAWTRPWRSPTARSTAWAPTCRARTSRAARAVAARIRSGQVHINYPAWNPHAPFGGYKRSGNGREYGVEGLEEYLETKAILGFQDAPTPSAA